MVKERDGGLYVESITGVRGVALISEHADDNVPSIVLTVKNMPAIILESGDEEYLSPQQLRTNRIVVEAGAFLLVDEGLSIISHTMEIAGRIGVRHDRG